MVTKFRRFVRVVLAAGCLGPAASADEQGRTGSGFFVNTQGWLVTSAHVVEGCQAVEVNGVPAVAVLPDGAADLALVHAPQPEAHPRLTLRRNGVDLAEPVALVGYPLPALLSEGVKVSLGAVNALAGPRGDARYFQLSAPAQPGNSGGPVLDENGLVLGVFAATLASDAFADAQNVNFAVTTAEVIRMLEAGDVAYRDLTWPRGAVVQLGGPTIADRAAEAAAAVVLVRCLE